MALKPHRDALKQSFPMNPMLFFENNEWNWPECVALKIRPTQNYGRFGNTLKFIIFKSFAQNPVTSNSVNFLWENKQFLLDYSSESPFNRCWYMAPSWMSLIYKSWQYKHQIKSQLCIKWRHVNHKRQVIGGKQWVGVNVCREEDKKTGLKI